MPTKKSCDGCLYMQSCPFDRAIKCLTNNYALRKEEGDEETNSRETPVWKMEGENPG